MWAARPRLANIFEKLLDQKTFICLRLSICSQCSKNSLFLYIVSRETWFLEKPTARDSARLGHIPSLPWESQLPLKPYLSLQPSDFKGNCDSYDSLLDFCFRLLCSFYLLRKCGLLAHTSPTFLKNCWIKKLLFACGLVFAANVLKTACFYTLFHVKHDS